MTTATDVSLDFERAAALRRAVRDSSVDAKLDVKAAVDSGIFKEALHLLVGIGMLSAEQARALWEAITGGTFVPLPAIPWPDSAAELGLYDAIRAKLERAHAAAGEVDFGVDDLLGIGEAVIAVVHMAEAVGEAVSSLWHSIFG